MFKKNLLNDPIGQELIELGIAFGIRHGIQSAFEHLRSIASPRSFEVVIL